MKENNNKMEPTTAQPKDKAPTTEQPKHNPIPDNFLISKEGLNELLQVVEASIQNKYLKNAVYDCINANAKPFYTGTSGKV